MFSKIASTATVLVSLTSASLALGGCTAPSSDPSSSDPQSENHAGEHAEGQATAILNAGVMAEIGTITPTRVKFLFDPLYDNHFGSLQELSADLIAKIVAGDAPYDDVSAVFVSHAHGDHFSAKHLTALLAAQPDVKLVAPAQAIKQMREAPAWQEGFKERVTEIALENGEDAQAFELAGAQIEAFRSPHNGYPERHAEIHNITYRVTAGGADEGVQRVMHMGDADPAKEHLEPHSEFLSSARTGLAIVPFWFLNVDDAETVIDSTLNAESAVGMHVPVEEPEWLAGSGFEYFTGEGQEVAIPGTGGKADADAP